MSSVIIVHTRNWIVLHSGGEVIHWGDVPTWVAGIGTWVAGIGAVLVYIRLYGLERRRDQRDASARERAQAEKISVYWAKREGFAARLVVGNVSDQPITATSVYALYNEREVAMKQSPGIVPPQAREEVAVLDRHNVWAIAEGPNPNGIADSEWFGPMFGIRFTDAEGRRWHRHTDGRLHMEGPTLRQRRWWRIR